MSECPYGGGDHRELIRQAKAEALRDAADAWTQGAWANTPRHAERVRDRMAASQYAGDWLRERADLFGGMSDEPGEGA